MFNGDVLGGILAVAALGGLIGLDRTAVGQFMVSQPLVAGSLVGAVLGDAAGGLIIGAVLQLLWVMDLPIGTFVPANATIMTIFATGSAVLGSPGGAPPAVLSFCLLLSTALAQPTMAADRFVRAVNGVLAARVDAAAAGQDLEGRMVRVHWTGMGIFYLKTFVLILLSLPPGIAAVHLFRHAPAALHDAAAFLLVLLPLTGAAAMVRRLTVRIWDPSLLVGFALAAGAGLLLGVPAVFLPAMAAAAGWIGAGLGQGRV